VLLPQPVLTPSLIALQEGQTLRVATGGVGGFGNMQIRGQQFQGPSRVAAKGRPGTACLLLLECKTIADVGFVGLPNAGKSTLLSAISAARAKVRLWLGLGAWLGGGWPAQAAGRRLPEPEPEPGPTS
jgi:hypothetical protein